MYDKKVKGAKVASRWQSVSKMSCLEGKTQNPKQMGTWRVHCG